MNDACKIAVVTGTSSGLGKALVANLLKDHWYVLGIARREMAVQEGHYSHVPLDLSLPADVSQRFPMELDRWLAIVRELSGRKEPSRVALVNNAGVIGPIATTSDLKASALEATLNINATSPIWLMGHFINRFNDRDLRIVNISSGAARHPYASWGPYCSSKAALRMASQVVAEEYKAIYADKWPKLRLAIVSFAPGVIDTPMQTEVRAAAFPARQRFVDLHTIGRLITAEKPAQVICDLLAKEALPLFSEESFA